MYNRALTRLCVPRAFLPFTKNYIYIYMCIYICIFHQSNICYKLLVSTCLLNLYLVYINNI